jgi:hypothetical protein
MLMRESCPLDVIMTLLNENCIDKILSLVIRDLWSQPVSTWIVRLGHNPMNFAKELQFGAVFSGVYKKLPHL